MSAWFDYNATSLPELSPESRKFVEYMTGSIPLLLQSLFQFKGKEFDQTALLDVRELLLVQEDITSFYDTLFGDPALADHLRDRSVVTPNAHACFDCTTESYQSWRHVS